MTITGAGELHYLCRSHGVRALRLVDAVVVGLSDEDRALALTLGARDKLSEARRRHELLAPILPRPSND